MAPPKKTRLAFVALAIAIPVIAVVGVSAARVTAQPAHSVRSSVTVTMPTSGAIAKLAAANGSVVRKGDVVAILDTASLQAELDKAQAELAAAEQAGNGAIQPMSGINLAGRLPQALPVTEHVRVPVATTQSAQPAATPAPKLQGKEAFDVAASAAAAAQKELAKATEALTAANKLVQDAQKSRDALRPKVAKAEGDAMTAQRKADGAKDLLANGAISANRSAELLADKDTTKKVWDDLAAQAKAADKALSDAQAAQKAAQDQLAKAQSALAAADANVSKAQSETTITLQAAKPAGQPQQSKVTYFEKLVTRRELVRTEEPKPIPLQVWVDEGTLKSTTSEIAQLRKHIEELKSAIAAARIVAPTDGQITWLVSPGKAVAPATAIAIIR